MGTLDRYLFRNGAIAQDLSSLSVDLWLCGHEHHNAWRDDNLYSNGRTTFLNVASLNRAYGTGESQSFVLSMEENCQSITAVRRLHGTAGYDAAPIEIPLSHPFRYGDARFRVEPPVISFHETT
jgi:hypothetical protein